jgi:transposase
MVEPLQIADMGAEQLRALALELMAKIAAQQGEIAIKETEIASKESEIAAKDREILFKQARIDQLTHEMALLKRWKFGTRSEQLNSEQKCLIEETIDADLAAIDLELDQLVPAPKTPDSTNKPRRVALPAHLPRVTISHEPESTTCACGCQLKRIGEDVSERLDYVPGVFSVERHVRGKWACAKCQTLIQAPVPAQVIDKGIPTAGLLAQVSVAKYADHMPLYRLEGVFERAGYPIPRSTQGQWVGACGVQLQPLVDALKSEVLAHGVLHADETPVAMLMPGNKKTHRAYLWAYAAGYFEDIKACWRRPNTDQQMRIVPAKH